MNARLHPARAAGFTLIELLTSVSIALVLSVLATTAFLHVRSELNRIQVRLQMHNSARFLYQSMSEHFSAMQQDAAFWVETTKDDGTGTGMVSITFLKGKTDEHEYEGSNGNLFNGGQDYSIYDNRCCDLAWCSWQWHQGDSAIYTGTNSPPHQFSINTPWVGPTVTYGAGNGNAYFVNMPQPLVQATPYPGAPNPGSSQAALNGNRLGTTDPVNDLSDYQDLAKNMSPVIHNVTACTLELVMADGTVVDANDGTTMTLPCDGNFIDGHTAASSDGTLPYLKRPRLIRLLIDMTDPVTKISQSFSFSFQPPGLLPLVNVTGSVIP
jgi:prepilin-type N-terminal cleavage/methylation domain-containing protein